MMMARPPRQPQSPTRERSRDNYLPEKLPKSSKNARWGQKLNSYLCPSIEDIVLCSMSIKKLNTSFLSLLSKS